MDKLEIYDDETTTDRIPKSRTVELGDSDVAFSTGDDGEIAFGVRTGGPFKCRAFYLDSAYDWVVGDDGSNMILVPLRKG